MINTAFYLTTLHSIQTVTSVSLIRLQKTETRDLQIN